jgi:outer membrane protein TolC
MHNAVLRAEEQMNVASAELAQLVNLDPSLNLRTVGGALSTIELVDALVPLEELVVIANGRRPELASASAAIDRSRVRVRQEQTRVLFPTIMLGYSPGAFGGNGNFVGGIPPFASITGREDYDVWCYWTAQNMGVGNVAQTRRQRGMLGQAMADRLRVLNEVRAQVAEAYNDAHAFLQRAEEAQLGLESSTSGFREDLNRQRSGEGLPLEVLNSVRLMATERQDLATAVVGYNEAQFRLFVALGQPPTCVRSSSAPQNGPSSTTEPIFRGEPVGASGIR